MIVCLGAFPAVRHLFLPSDVRPPCPLLALAGIFYAVLFGVSTFLTSLMHHPSGKIDIYGNVLINGISLHAQFLVIIALVLAWAGHLLSRTFLWPRLPSFRLPHHSEPKRLTFLLWGLAIAHFSYLVFPGLRQLPTVGQFLQPLGFLVFALFYVQWCRNELPRLQAAIIFLVLLPLELLYTLRSGFLTNLALFGILYIVLRVWLHRRLPWIFIIVAPMLLILTYPVLPAFRGAVWYQKRDATVVEAAAIYATRLVEYYVPRSFSKTETDSQAASVLDRFTKDSSLSTVRRLGLIHKFSYVMEKTPSEIPYWNGATYKPLLTSFIPRVLWPGKPRETTGYAFGVRYQIIHPEETWHSYNLPWIIEMYANFGNTGVLVGMTLVGVFIAFLESFFSRPTMTPTETMIGMTIIFPLFYQESNFSLMVGSLLPLTVALWLYFAIGLRIPLPAFIQTWRKKWRR